MFSFNVILALTPSLLVFFYLRGESERGSWAPIICPTPPWLEVPGPCLEVPGPTALIENPSKFHHLSGALKDEEK